MSRARGPVNCTGRNLLCVGSCAGVLPRAVCSSSAPAPNQNQTPLPSGSTHTPCPPHPQAGIILWLMFAILGTHLFAGSFYACTDPAVRLQAECTGTFTMTTNTTNTTTGALETRVPFTTRTAAIHPTLSTPQPP